MEVKIGDVFRDSHKSYIEYLFKVVEIVDHIRVNCEVHLANGCLRRSIEHKNTLLKMQKLSSLEKELL